MPLLPNAGPPRPITHQAIDHQVLINLATLVETKAQGGPARMPILEEVAESENVPLSHVVASLGVNPQIIPDVDSQTLIAICVGTCQGQGAIPVLDKLLELKKERDANAKPSFSIVPRSCLDMCAHSPVCISRSAHGQAAHPRLKPEQVQETIDALCDTAS
jgi:NADH:ubiquinone oxidoreductase subunit E